MTPWVGMIEAPIIYSKLLNVIRNSPKLGVSMIDDMVGGPCSGSRLVWATINRHQIQLVGVDEVWFLWKTNYFLCIKILLESLDYYRINQNLWRANLRVSAREHYKISRCFGELDQLGWNIRLILGEVVWISDFAQMIPMDFSWKTRYSLIFSEISHTSSWSPC